MLAVAYAHLGRIDEARAAIQWRLDLMNEQGFVGDYLRYMMFVSPFEDEDLEKRIADGYVKAGVPAKTGEYYPSSIFLTQRLSVDDIESLVFGRIATGFDYRTEEKWSIERAEDGKALYRSGNSHDMGRSWLEDNRLCNQWDNTYNGLRDCAPVFRNPEGSSENKDEYIGISAYGFVPFSVER